MMQTRAYETGWDETTWSVRWACTYPTCHESGTADTARAAEVLAQAHADIHAVTRRGW